VKYLHLHSWDGKEENPEILVQYYEEDYRKKQQAMKPGDLEQASYVAYSLENLAEVST
jgi:hypothetical protein